jgi:ATP-dependent DNA ligase
MRLSPRSEPFDSDWFVYELKIEGFRALAHLQDRKGELVSRNGNVFRGFAELATWIAEHLRVESAVLDGEIACLDESGRPTFRDLILRKRQCIFIAFDLLYLNGKRPADAPVDRTKANVEKADPTQTRANVLSGSRRKRWSVAVRRGRQNGSGRNRLQAQGFALQSHGEALSVLD